MPEDGRRLEHLVRLRDELLDEMETADREFTEVRMRVERMESDMRIGRPEPSAYAEAKGHVLPQAEGRVLDAFRNLLKLEDKIKAESRAD